MTVSDEKHWEAFVKQMRGFVSRRVSDPNDADDIVQEVFLKVHERIGTLRDGSRFAPWLYRIARNAIVDHYRVRRPHSHVSEELPAPAEDGEKAPAQQIAAGLGIMVADLPAMYREAVKLVEIEGLTQRELAAQLGISLAGAKSRVQRGRALLRKDLLSCCHFEFDVRGKLMDYVPRVGCCECCGSRKKGR